MERCRNILGEEVADPVAVFRSPCRVRVRAEAVYEDNARH